MPNDSSRQRPPLEGHRSNSSNKNIRSNTESDSPASPPSIVHKSKTTKAHHVGVRAGLHGRNLSYGKLHKAKAQEAKRLSIISPSTSPPPEHSVKSTIEDAKLARDASTTSLKKNLSSVSLKRNRSTADVRRPARTASHVKRSSSHSKVHQKQSPQKSSVHFDLGNDENEDGDGWTEASGSASPNLSRSVSVKGQTSGRSSVNAPASANNSGPSSPGRSPSSNLVIRERPTNKQSSILDAHQITSKLLNRTQNAPPKMSEVSAVRNSGISTPSTDSYQRTPSTMHNTPHGTQNPVVSRFVDGTNGTPSDVSPYVPQRLSQESRDLDGGRKVKSMANLTTYDSPSNDSDEERPLAPRSRKGASQPYKPPQTSRTQQKLWLQRASSNVEPQQLPPSAAISINGFPALAVNASPLVGTGYDGRDPRVKLQLERTGMEYLVVRRYQDPIGRAARRLPKLPGGEKFQRIPNARAKYGHNSGASVQGLSQSLKESNLRDRTKDGSVSLHGDRTNYDGSANGSIDSAEGDVPEPGGLSALLRGLWEKGTEMSPSAE